MFEQAHPLNRLIEELKKIPGIGAKSAQRIAFYLTTLPLEEVEGLAVDKNITLADLKGTLFEFCRCLFGEERKVRFRCDYFPFVEPGVEVAIECSACDGTGCRLCGYSGWIEILGAGMVHPDVLSRVDIDPELYSGFAFGYR